MSRLLPDDVRRDLARSKLIPRSARPAVGVGERRSRAIGSGLEFADFRAYQPGDDIRYLDRHVRARLGQDVIRQYSIDKQLEVTVVVDASESMSFGRPSKLQRVLELTAALVFATVGSGDRARVGVGRRASLEWYPPITGHRGIGELLKWLESISPGGAFDARRVAAGSHGATGEGMLFLISDFLTDEAPYVFDVWGANGAEVVAVQILEPDELAAGWLEGESDLEDVETGERLRLDSAELADGYADALQGWQSVLAGRVRRYGGSWFSFSTELPVVGMLRELRARELLR